MNKTGILIVGDAGSGRLANVSLESITKALALAGAIGGDVCAAVMGADTAALAAQAGRYGAKKVFAAEGADFATFRSGAYTDAAMAAIKAADPAVVLFSGSPDGRDLASACAARLGVGVLVDITGLEVGRRQAHRHPSLLRRRHHRREGSCGRAGHRHRALRLLRPRGSRRRS